MLFRSLMSSYGDGLTLLLRQGPSILFERSTWEVRLLSIGVLTTMDMSDEAFALFMLFLLFCHVVVIQFVSTLFVSVSVKVAQVLLVVLVHLHGVVGQAFAGLRIHLFRISSFEARKQHRINNFKLKYNSSGPYYEFLDSDGAVCQLQAEAVLENSSTPSTTVKGVETAIAGSARPFTTAEPDFGVYFYETSNNVVLGVGFRYGDEVVTPLHVWEAVENLLEMDVPVSMRHGSKQLDLSDTHEIRAKGHNIDYVALGFPPGVFARLGLKSAKIGSLCQGSSCLLLVVDSDGKWQATSCTTERNGRLFEFEHNASTVAGNSGGLFLMKNRVVGYHTRFEKPRNFGVCLEFLMVMSNEETAHLRNKMYRYEDEDFAADYDPRRDARERREREEEDEWNGLITTSGRYAYSFRSLGKASFMMGTVPAGQAWNDAEDELDEFLEDFSDDDFGLETAKKPIPREHVAAMEDLLRTASAGAAEPEEPPRPKKVKFLVPNPASEPATSADSSEKVDPPKTKSQKKKAKKAQEKKKAEQEIAEAGAQAKEPEDFERGVTQVTPPTLNSCIDLDLIAGFRERMREASELLDQLTLYAQSTQAPRSIQKRSD